MQRLLELSSRDIPSAREDKRPVIVWFRQDLRLHDNPALLFAAQSGRNVIPVFVHVEQDDENWLLGGAAKFWLHQSLTKLSESLERKYGSKLIIRAGSDTLAGLLDVMMETGASTLCFNRVYEPWKLARDAKIVETLTMNGLTCSSYKAVVLFEPLEVVPDSKEGLMYGFGSVGFFLNACDGKEISDPLPPPEQLRPPRAWPGSLSIGDLRLYVMPCRRNGQVVDWAKGMREFWEFGEEGALKALEEFVRFGCHHFEGRQRFRADRKYTAVISPYVRFGELSPRRIFHEIVVRHRYKAKTFLRRLAWRDLAYWCLWKFPTMADHPLRPQYAHQTWDYDQKQLRAWQRGRTGFPLVDAAMRQLWVTGWMPNYMRHVVAGFLIEHMNMHWVDGEKWFHDTLVDADVAINAYMWQNGGHSGLDQWNFVMHPVFAAKSCDPEGDYVRRWVPELSKLPPEYIHCPWEAPVTLLASSGVALGRNYPHRIIADLEGARTRSLAAVNAVRCGVGKAMVLPDGHERMILPDGR
ncbi:hypothetical protein GUITHDRAFT_74169 [Guillardia theta CCMP2712]|uniref:Photolyase/cryptochrome alpha/beta domain-containing protein n=2 Tax=Guillardia theta TaxID=55529 RepID=L1J295_GUITC|nr:hypothetical protein GUITHDRAFT_74169 [Guillardia theta CCMP2712]EKX42215.1 hypothetical protein GUITHDRAFT_74169 [Guillardia theta CCMP2712]|eukprot:XP_005829195.1 hypothetical protein GUITHDRAFT_74169 [Guillardia theta CCMP2712]